MKSFNKFDGTFHTADGSRNNRDGSVVRGVNSVGSFMRKRHFMRKEDEDNMQESQEKADASKANQG